MYIDRKLLQTGVDICRQGLDTDWSGYRQKYIPTGVNTKRRTHRKDRCGY